MTEEEKQRLQELLNDVDELEEGQPIDVRVVLLHCSTSPIKILYNTLSTLESG